MKEKALPIICFLFISLIVYYEMSCNSQTQKPDLNEKEKMQQKGSFNKVDSLKMFILKGDTLAYLKLRNIYVNNDNAPELLPWALIMANGYKYAPAYYDVYFCFQQIEAYYTNGNYNSLNFISFYLKF